MTHHQTSHESKVVRSTSGSTSQNRPLHFSFFRRAPDMKDFNYKKQVENIALVETVEDFWNAYVNFHRLGRLAPLTEYFLFWKNCYPDTEDESYRHGGKLFTRVTKSATPKVFEALCLAFVGGQFNTNDVCGIVCSVRVAEDILSIWLKDTNNAQLVSHVEVVARQVLGSQLNSTVRNWTFKSHHREFNCTS